MSDLGALTEQMDAAQRRLSAARAAIDHYGKRPKSIPFDATHFRKLADELTAPSASYISAVSNLLQEQQRQALQVAPPTRETFGKKPST
jgi:hypothetical protein